MAAPRFSILTPVYETPADVLEAMLASVRRQTLGEWELCLVDDCSTAPHVAEILTRHSSEDARIKVRTRAENGGIVAASNDALEIAEGEFLSLLDHDDELHCEALALVDAALSANPEVDYVYTDEDKIDREGTHSGPFFKPDWSPERMRTQMYSCHLSTLRRELVEAVGGFDPEFEGSQDWDLVLKVTERARAVAHVPRVLYHWRMIETSAAGGGEAAKPWAFEAGKRAVQAHCERIGLQARVERDPSDSGVYHLQPQLTEQPLVSIIIPSRGTVREVRYDPVVLVNHCVGKIVAESTYENYEILCVLDADTPQNVPRELREIGGERVRLIEYDRPFSFSMKINVGAVRARGEHLLLLNDDTEITQPDWLERLVMYSSLEGIGAVGGRLLWEDGRLQHVGIRFEEGLPGHPYYGYPGDYPGYANELRIAQNALAVTGACMMTPKALFEEVGGLSTILPVNYNDVDYCMKLVAAGQRIVYDPDLVLLHFEGASRSSEVEDWEKAVFLGRWGGITATDPYSNPNLRLGAPRLSSHLDWMRGRLRSPRALLRSR